MLRSIFSNHWNCWTILTPTIPAMMHGNIVALLEELHV